VVVEFVQRVGGHPARVGILAGSFNPPTIAHFELLRAASAEVDETVCVLPTAFPHKDYSGATMEQRLSMLRQLPCSIATTQQGLLIDIARECRAFYGASTAVSLLCGADAAERILNWDYGRAGVVEELLKEFELLVAPRGSVYQPAPGHIHRIRPLQIEGGFHEVSSTEVRTRIRRGEAWEHLVPEPIVELVREIYS
jgi:nicotinate (nicotinamide) nucleotide adenylyltransferase